MTKRKTANAASIAMLVLLAVGAGQPAGADMRRAEIALDRPMDLRPRQPETAREVYREIKTINRAVNDLPLTDCKAFAFEKVRRLEAAGIKGLFVVVRTETGTAHAIVVVEGWALDNRYRRVVTVAQLRAAGYYIAPLG